MEANIENIDSIIQNHTPLLIDFWAEWCRPCKMFAPVLDEIVQENTVWLAKVDIDQNQELADRYEIVSVPTTLVFKDGKLVDRIIGAKPKHTFMKDIERWL